MRITSCWTRARGMSLLTVLVFLVKILNDGLPVLASPTSLPGSSDELHRRADLETNLTMAIAKTRKGFLCNVPQQRAYNLMDLMKNLSLHGTEVIANQPTYLVLNRCDVHSGCCGSVEKSCSPASTYFEDVEVEISSVSDKCEKNVWIKVEHHRKCHCKPTNSSERAAFASQLPNVFALGDHRNAPCNNKRN